MLCAIVYLCDLLAQVCLSSVLYPQTRFSCISRPHFRQSVVWSVSFVAAVERSGAASRAVGPIRTGQRSLMAQSKRPEQSQQSCLTSTLAEQARAKYSTGGVQYINVNLLGTAPCNRSGLGVSGFHVHEVVGSIKSDGLSRRRYRDASVVKVPAEELDAFRDFNRRMCESDELLPPFAPHMRYALLTKNTLSMQ